MKYSKYLTKIKIGVFSPLIFGNYMILQRYIREWLHVILDVSFPQKYLFKTYLLKHFS